MDLTYKNAKKQLLIDLDLSCQQFFLENSFVLENAYCEILNENLEKAKELLAKIKDNNIRAHWLLIMISFIEGAVIEYPTYFELRNFLEIDLNLLIKYCKGTYVENIIRYSDYMFTINPEVHKFIGRVLYNNDLKEQAMFFLKKAKDYFYNDPELHFLLAYIYFENKDFVSAGKSINNCLCVLPEYYPAINLRNKLLNKDISLE